MTTAKETILVASDNFSDAVEQPPRRLEWKRAAPLFLSDDCDWLLLEMELTLNAAT